MTSSKPIKSTDLISSSRKKKKAFGRVYTPNSIVSLILDLAGYQGKNIVKRHVIDNSCGDGAFLTEIVRRYCQESSGNLKEELEEYIHGIEIDPEECAKCVSRLNEIVVRFGVKDVKWDVFCADTLTVDKYDGKMDYVLGNPPYIRVHNLGGSFDIVKQFQFAQGGMTDLYLVFYEIGLKMLSSNGVLGYITPSSFFNSKAGDPLRKSLVKNNLLSTLVDLEHFQAFESATAYTTIVVLEKNRTQSVVNLYKYNGNLCFVDKLTKDDFCFNGCFYFSSRDDLRLLREIINLGSKGNRFEVKNGFATLADSFFIGDSLDFEYTIPVVKASTGKWTRCVFPYLNGKLIPFEKIAKCRQLGEYYSKHVDLLERRSLANSNDWHGFGRSQGIKDVYKNKYAINVLLRDVRDLKLVCAPSGTGVYSGLYILSNLSYEELNKLFYSNLFIKYISLLKKYKSGGYYTFSSKDLKIYLEYAFVKMRKKKDN